MTNEQDNYQRWDGVSPGHYEVWYLTFNIHPSGAGIWLRYTLEAPIHEAPYTQLWFAYFHPNDPAATFAINKKFSIDKLTSQQQPFSLSIANASLTHTSAQGTLHGKDRQVSWDLSWPANNTTHFQLPKSMYLRGGIGDTTVLTPTIHTHLQGNLQIDGKTLPLNNAPGGQTHLWGRKHAHEWAWGHCNAFEDHPDAALETLTVRLKKAGYVLPPITLVTLYLHGKEYRWTRFIDALRTAGSYGTAHYSFSAHGLHTRLEGEYICDPQNMVCAQYVDPDGDPAWCQNTEVGDLTIRVYERSGLLGKWAQLANLRANKKGHFEIGSRIPVPSPFHVHTPI